MDKKYLFCNGDSWVVGHMLDTEWMRNKHLSNQNITYVQFKKQIGEQDEWTWFVENTDYHHEAHLEQVKGKFTGVVSDKLGLEEINIAQPGKSNESIVRTTIEWMLDNKDILDETFFLIGLTTSRRTESVNVDKDMYIHDWNPNKDSEVNNLHTILTLQNYFKVNNVDYMFVDLFCDVFLPMNYNTRDSSDLYHQKFSTTLSLYDSLLEELDKDCFFSTKSLVDIIEESVVDGHKYCELQHDGTIGELKNDDGFVGHPSLASSKIIGDLIYEKIFTNSR